MWYIGQKVRCINGRFPRQVSEWGSNLPQEGKIYTIRWITPTRCAITGVVSPGFLLEELTNPENRLHFSQHRFVPLSLNGSAANSTEQSLQRITKRYEWERQQLAPKVQRMLEILRQQ
jgi:hypothetical protein